jgi:hypothetical protein
MKCQSGLGWRQAKVTLQQINGLVHDKGQRLVQGGTRTMCRLLVALILSPDLFDHAKDLLVEASVPR